MATIFDVGDRVLIEATFKRLGMLIDPTTVEAEVKSPDGTSISYVYGIDPELTRTSVGLYVLAIDVTLAGVWQIRYTSTGAAQAAEQTAFTARSVNT